MADRIKYLKDTLKMAHRAIYAACYTEDGLDAGDGEIVLARIAKELGFDPSPKRCGACKKPMSKCDGH